LKLARAGATLNPFVGTLDIEWRGGVDPPERRPEVLERDGAQQGGRHPQLPVDVLGQRAILGCGISRRIFLEKKKNSKRFPLANVFKAGSINYQT
jgi:hypothetical protein